MQIRWQDDAINVLIQVRRFIAMDNLSAAARVANRIRSAVSELAG
jgi:plasmid stabilization system protein ParE